MKTTIVGRKCTPKDSFKLHAEKKLDKINAMTYEDAQIEIALLESIERQAERTAAALQRVLDLMRESIRLRNQKIYKKGKRSK